MARGAAQTRRPQRPKQERKRKQATPAYEQTMFFPRLRRQAKWMFLFLAIVFAVGFVAFGVGSGSTGIGDILHGNFFGGGTSTSDRINDKQDEIKRNPNDIGLYLDLAGIYQQDQREEQALTTLRRARTIAPRNIDVLNRIAGIYSGRAEQARVAAQDAQIEYVDNAVTSPVLDPSSTLGQAIAADPYSNSLRSVADEAYQKMTTAFQRSEAAYKEVLAVARGTSQEPNALLQLAGAAQIAGDTTSAITAYERFLKIAPDNPNAAAVRQNLAQLMASVGQTQG